MRLVGRGKKGQTRSARKKKPKDPYSTGIFDPPGRIGRDRTHIAVRVCRERNRRSPAHRSASPGTRPQGRGSLRQTTDRAAARNSRTPFGRSDAARGVVVENIPGSGRAPQVRVARDAVIGRMQALLTRECVAKGFGIRRLDGAQPGDEALLVLDRDAVEALRKALRGAISSPELRISWRECRLIFAWTAGACITTIAIPAPRQAAPNGEARLRSASLLR